MILFTDDAKKFITDSGIREMYLELRYTKGPCNDNLCKMIPHVYVSLEKHKGSYDVVFEDVAVRIFASPPIARSIEKHRDNPVISKSKLGRKLRVSGLTYSF